MEKPKALTKEEIENILPSLPGWTYTDDKLTREFEFRDFVDSLNFINSLVAYFETMDHHPDCHIFYSKVKFELTRYDIGGKVTDRDIEVAKKISETYESRKKFLS